MGHRCAAPFLPLAHTVAEREKLASQTSPVATVFPIPENFVRAEAGDGGRGRVCLPRVHRARVLSPVPHKLCVTLHTCSFSSLEVKARESEAQDNPRRQDNPRLQGDLAVDCRHSLQTHESDSTESHPGWWEPETHIHLSASHAPLSVSVCQLHSGLLFMQNDV